MKKFKIVSMLIVLLIVSCISHSTYAICDTYVSPSANKQVNAVRLTLSDGTILHDIQITKDIKKGAVTTETSYKTFNLNILVDTGMDGNSLSVVKNSLRQLVNKLYTYYGKYSGRLNIKVICFNNELNEEEEEVWVINKKGQTAILNEINNIQTNNTKRDIGQAVKLAARNYDEWQPGNNSTKLQSLIIATDGITANNSEEYKEMYQQANVILRDLSSNHMVSMFNLSIEDYSYTVSNLILKLKTSEEVLGVRNIDTMLYDFNSNLMSEQVYGDIEKRLINIETIVPVGLKGDAQMTNNTIILYVDDELLFGSKLEIEYVINYSPGSRGGYPWVLDKEIGSKLFFDPNAKLLTEPNVTNAQKGWYWDASNNMAKKNSVGSSTKIVLSTTLTADNIPDGGYTNFANVGGIQVTSMTVKILPPYGQEDIIEDLTRIVLLVIAIVLVLALYKIYNRPKDDQ